MAAPVIQLVVSRWTGVQKSRANYIRALEPGNLTALKDLETMVLGLPHFEVYSTSDTNTAGTVLDLTAQGVTFGDATCRLIIVKAYLSDNDGQGVLETKFLVDGGATPIVPTPDVADADPIIAGLNLASTPTLTPSVSTANVILTAVGITGVPTRWVIHVFVGESVPLAYNP